MKNPSSTRPSLRVVLIDDDPAFGSRASRMLEVAGFSTRFHRGPFGSLQALREHACEVVVLDIGMPKLDGPLVARLIRETFGSRIRIVLCSNMERETLERIAQKLDADGILPKSMFDEGKIDEIVAVLRARKDSSRPKAMPSSAPPAHLHAPSVAPQPISARHRPPQSLWDRPKKHEAPPPAEAAASGLVEDE